MPGPPAPEALPELPPRPQPPAPADCCGGGCAACVFDLYDAALQQWERQVAEILDRRRTDDAQDRRP